MSSSAQQGIDEESYSSWRQRSELENMADLPKELEDELAALDTQFWVSGEKLREIVQRFREELREGLSRDGQNIPMNLAWTGLPSGKETGQILTLDLGGTNLRVCKVTLHGDKPGVKEKAELDQEQYKIPEALKTGEADDLWTFIAAKLETFFHNKKLNETYSKDKPMPLGFTFSYPATQSRIDHAVLQTWTKGFDINGVEGKDVAQQLHEKLEANNLPFELICIINDTVGALVASAYTDPATIIGAIFGTGCNAAYMASVSDISKVNVTEQGYVGEKMAINCEYGAFDNAHRVLPRTEFDKMIDELSPRPGEQAFEKLSAGLYLGEIFRLVLVDLVGRELLFRDQDTEKLKEEYVLDTGFLSAVENDGSSHSEDTRKLFKSTLDIEVSDVEIEFSRRVAEMVAVRGARLCACGVAAICGMEEITEGHVAADGSVANKHPKFGKRWGRALGEILGWEEEGRIRIVGAEDGSGLGCAVVAGMEIERRSEYMGRDM
ncbi:hexokinase-domain-containing protein [Paraphoma chrysanthemicola]|nr:hexokinase-domain-containing protein [Paraphoma chrysanthemicola]